MNNRFVAVTSLALLAGLGALGAQQPSAPAGRTDQAAGQPATAGRAAVATARATIVIEAESLIGTAQVSAQAPAPIRQEMAGFGAGWGGNAQLFWRPPAPVDQPTRNWPNVKLWPQIAAAGTYTVSLVYTQAPDFGNARVFINGQARGDLAGYAPTVRTMRLECGDSSLRAGVNEVLVTVFGKAPASSGFAVGLDRLEIKRK